MGWLYLPLKKVKLVNTQSQALSALYGNKVRVRACGICIKDDKILMVSHAIYGSEFWSPPGGGLEFGEKVADGLAREFKEETGLEVEVGEMLFMNEFIEPPLHAIEIFLNISSWKNEIVTGSDPEFSGNQQVISHVSFLTLEQIRSLNKNAVHSLFHQINSLKDIYGLKGFI